MEKLKKVTILKIIIFTVFIGLSNLSLSFEKIDYDNISEYKKEIFRLNDDNRKDNLRNIIFETSDLMDMSNKKTSGENFLDVMENKDKKLNTEYYIYTKCKSIKDCMVKNSINIYNKIFTSTNPLEVGPSFSYSYKKNNESNINKLNVGINLKYKISDYNLRMNIKQDFVYSHISNNDISNNDYSLNGAINTKMYVGNNFKIVPELRASYLYRIKNKLKDQNNDLIILKNSLDYSIGLGLNLEYRFIKKIKVKLGLGYAYDKEFYSKNSYEIYGRELEKNITNVMNHTIKVYSNINIYDIHNLKILFLYSYKNEYIASLLYNINF